MEDDRCKELAARAVDGDRTALGELLEALTDPVYGLALRMLGGREDARDATQEVLVRVATRLSSYRGDSRLTTWVYRIASNYLVDVRRRGRGEEISFESVAARLERTDAPAAGIDGEQRRFLAREVFLGCTLGMLRCLDRPQRMAFIVGAILELDMNEAAAVLELPPATYRKRLSRARQRLSDFMTPRCGVVDEAAPCRCERQVDLNVAEGLLDPRQLVPATRRDTREARAGVEAIGSLVDAVELFRRHPDFTAPDNLVRGLRAMLDSETLGTLH